MDQVAIIGAGNVGKALGHRLKQIGVAIRFGVRDTGKQSPEALSALGPSFGVAEACEPAGLIFLAVPAESAVQAANAASKLGSKILVDCTNPLRWLDGPVWSPPVEGSVSAALAAALPGVRVVKAFCHFGAEIHADPRIAGGAADAYIAGDDEAAKSEVGKLAERMGFRSFDAGGLRNAAVLENLAVLWIHLAMKGGLGRSFAFRAEGRPL